jgi:hypothetical protein
LRLSICEEGDMAERALDTARMASVAEYKRILRDVLERRPSGTRQRLATALGKNRSFVTQISNPNYLVPIPVQHLPVIFEICHLSNAERAAFMQLYRAAHPRRIVAIPSEPRTRSLILTLPDLGDARRNRELDALITELAERIAQYAREK